MGLHDREYYRDTPGYERFLRDGLVSKTFIVINIFVFAIQLFIDLRYNNSFTLKFSVNPIAIFEKGEVWRLLTGAFLHGSLMHLAFNMLALWILGEEVEKYRSRREYAVMYLVAAIFSSFVWAICEYIFTPKLAEFWMMNRSNRFFPLEAVTAVGASGAISAVAVICTLYHPTKPMSLLFIQLPLWMMTCIFLTLDIMRLISSANSGIAVMGHLGGAFFGLLYFHFRWVISDTVIEGWRKITRLFSGRKGPPLKIYKPDARRPLPRTDIENGSELKKQMDEILVKIQNEGKDSLTEEEKQIMQRASEYLRKQKK